MEYGTMLFNSAATTKCTEQTTKEVELLIAALRSAYIAECQRLAPGT
jgi:hypothetical protein